MRRLLSLAVLSVLMLPGAASASDLNSFTIQPSIVNNGASTTGFLTMAFPDPAPTTVLLFSSDPSAAQVPASIVVPAFAQDATFTITSTASAPFTPVQISAWVGNTPRTANMSVNPAPPPGPTLKAVTLNPTSVVGGANSTGTVSFTGNMPQGANVFLTSSNPAVATVPSEMVVSAGKASGTFNVATKAVTAQTTATITATWIGKTASAVITVKPGAAPAADVVRVQKATWKSGLLRIEATSTNPNAILSVYSRAGNFMFNLTNNGGGKYSDQRGFIDRVTFISVRSNFGGRQDVNVGG
jgi:hypothetical protein